MLVGCSGGRLPTKVTEIAISRFSLAIAHFMRKVTVLNPANTDLTRQSMRRKGTLLFLLAHDCVSENMFDKTKKPAYTGNKVLSRLRTEKKRWISDVSNHVASHGRLCLLLFMIIPIDLIQVGDNAVVISTTVRILSREKRKVGNPQDNDTTRIRERSWREEEQE
jgi:hypothetical protein